MYRKFKRLYSRKKNGAIAAHPEDGAKKRFSHGIKNIAKPKITLEIFIPPNIISTVIYLFWIFYTIKMNYLVFYVLHNERDILNFLFQL